MVKKEFELKLSEKEKARISFQKEKGKIVKFTIQLETLVDKKVVPIARYDVAHGIAHQHIFNPDGTQKIKKLKFTTYNEAFTYAYNYVKLHWKTLVDNYKRKKLRLK